MTNMSDKSEAGTSTARATDGQIVEAARAAGLDVRPTTSIPDVRSRLFVALSSLVNQAITVRTDVHGTTDAERRAATELLVALMAARADMRAALIEGGYVIEGEWPELRMVTPEGQPHQIVSVKRLDILTRYGSR